MKYVIIRDDDTCALTPVACLERLYRPFLDRGLPVNLAVIPNVNTRATWADGSPEGFLLARRGDEPEHLPIARHPALLEYLRANPRLEPLHHGCEHTYLEFDQGNRADLTRRLDDGARCFADAGLTPPETFVAPYDQLSLAGCTEVAGRFRVFSTGWLDLRRLPLSWWPRVLSAKLRGEPHVHLNGLTLLTHPGCLLSHKHPPASILPRIQAAVARNQLTVLVTHWWEYFHGGRPNEAFIDVLHATAGWLARQPDVRVIKFSELADERSAAFHQVFPPVSAAGCMRPDYADATLSS